MPGHDWAAGIKMGLEECATLVLVVSQASLHSPNVANEWEYVLFQRQVPVYLLVFESVRFEPYTMPDCEISMKNQILHDNLEISELQ